MVDPAVPTPAELIAFVRELLTCRNGASHYCPNCDNSIDAERIIQRLTASSSSLATGAGPDDWRDLLIAADSMLSAAGYGRAVTKAEMIALSARIRKAYESAPVPLPDAAPSPCYWSIDDVGGDSVWETSCKHVFEFTDGGPRSNGMTWCGYCGKPLVERFTSDDVASSASPAKERP